MDWARYWGSTAQVKVASLISLPVAGRLPGIWEPDIQWRASPTTSKLIAVFSPGRSCTESARLRARVFGKGGTPRQSDCSTIIVPQPPICLTQVCAGNKMLSEAGFGAPGSLKILIFMPMAATTSARSKPYGLSHFVVHCRVKPPSGRPAWRP